MEEFSLLLIHVKELAKFVLLILEIIIYNSYIEFDIEVIV